MRFLKILAPDAGAGAALPAKPGAEVKPPVAPPEKKPEAPKAGEKSKVWNGVLQEQQKIQKGKAELAAEREALQKEKERVEKLSEQIAKLKDDPLGALEAHGVDWNTLAEAKIKKDKAAKEGKPAEKPAEAKVEVKPKTEEKKPEPVVVKPGATVEEQVKAEMDRREVEAARQQSDALKAKFKAEQKAYFEGDASKEFLAIRALGAWEQVADAVIEHVEKTNTWLDPKAAAVAVEEKLRKTLVEFRDAHPEVMAILAPASEPVRRLSESPSKGRDVKTAPPKAAEKAPGGGDSPTAARGALQDQKAAAELRRVRSAAAAAGLSVRAYLAQEREKAAVKA